MTTATIPVDLRNPGQVFACLGFMEAAEALSADVEAGFAWSDTVAQFTLRTEGEVNPFQLALDFIDEAAATAVTPANWRTSVNEISSVGPQVGSAKTNSPSAHHFPSSKPENMALPVSLEDPDGHQMTLTQWADGSSRDTFKLYSGNRSALKVVRDMKELIRALRRTARAELLADPLGITCPMGGSFNLDARGAWQAIDTGYSPDRLAHSISSSPVVQLLGAIGLENARPQRKSAFEYSYQVWDVLLPPILARAALACAIPGLAFRRFRLPLFRPNPNSRAVAWAQEESAP